MANETHKKIKIGIIGGTGLNNVNILEDIHELDVTTPFGMPSDKLICGKLGGTVECVLLSRHDRKHLTNPSNVNYRANLLAMKKAGCDIVLATTACGSLNENYRPGDLVIIDDFIDRTYKREQTYYDGTRADEGFQKICHMPMFPAFCAEMRAIMIEACERAKIRYHKSGTMLTVEGPRFSSRAESRMYQQWGAHCINMTTCPEVVLAKELGLPYASIGIVTDYDCWREDVEHDQHVDVASVLKTFKASLTNVTNLIIDVVPRFADYPEWHRVIKATSDMVTRSIM